jgi:glycosyltransferase involved in cell wall biosynthesis
MRVAIVHYWLVGMRGGEKVVEALCEMFPQADIFTHAYRPERIADRINQHLVRTTFIAKLPLARRLYRAYLPLMPLALEQLDLREYDLVISSESGPAKGVITRPETLHLCYCHTPMRYVWSMYFDYMRNANWAARIAISWLIHRLRLWDAQSASRVDFFVANSSNVSRQINKYYRRPSLVVHPPVDVDTFAPCDIIDHYYLCVGQLVRYKRFDLAIEACNFLAAPLVIIGEGEEYRNLRRLAGRTITFLGHLDAAALGHFYARCRALLFPGEEDFGIVPVEAMASGRPVIAFRRGGAVETVIPRVTGIFFDEQTQEALADAIREFEGIAWSFEPSRLVEQAHRFSKENFKRQIFAAIREAAQATGIVVPLDEPENDSIVPIERQPRLETRRRARAAGNQRRWRAERRGPNVV